MAGTEEDRGKKAEDEDLFEDLDEFFAPLKDAGWEEGEEGEEGEGEAAVLPPRPEGGEAESPEALEDWDVAIEVPPEEELLAEVPAAAAGPEEPTEPEEEEVEAVPEEIEEREREPVEAALGAESGAEAEGPLSLDDLRAGPPEYADLPGATGDEGQEEEEAEAALSAEDLFEEPEEEPALEEELAEEPPEEEEPALVGEAAGLEPEDAEGTPEPSELEAAAEHFASGMRETPEEVERELLSDLEREEAVLEAETVTAAPAPPEEAEGPTWQEAAEPVVEEPAPAAPVLAGRNLPAAAASGILLAAAVIALLVVGKGPFTWFAGAVVLLGQAELYAVMRARRFQPATLLGLVCGALIIAGAYLHGPVAVPFGLFLAVGLTVLWYMAAPASTRRSTTINAAATILGTAYVPFLASFAILLLAFPGNLGRNAFLVVVGLTVLYDVCAYAIGTLWGSRPLAPTISPQKSWEGAIGATFVLLLVALAIVPSIDPFDAPGRAVGLALVIALAAPLGDLVESALKRDLGVKDMGTILPGHGGILDRIDAILFTAPAAYYFLQLSF